MADLETTLMPLSAAHDALADLASQFHNEMLDDGITELEPDKWIDLYRSWLGSASLDWRSANVVADNNTTVTKEAGWEGRVRQIAWSWRPSPELRFREHGEHGMILEQLFLGTAFGEPTRTEWRSVPVVPQSEGVRE